MGVKKFFVFLAESSGKFMCEIPFLAEELRFLGVDSNESI